MGSTMAPPLPVPGNPFVSRSPLLAPQAGPSSRPVGVSSPMSYGAMTGISFTNGGGFSFENRGGTHRPGGVGSYGARFYGDGSDSPVHLGTSITMESSSFAANSAAFNLPPSSMSSSFRRTYAAAAAGGRGGNPSTLSSSLASMTFQPMSFGASYNKPFTKPRTDAELTRSYLCCGQRLEGMHALLEHREEAHSDADFDGLFESFSPVTHAMDLDLEGVDASLPLDAEGSTSSRSMSPAAMPTYPIPLTNSKSSTPGEQAEIIFTPLSISDVLTSPLEDSALQSAGDLSRTISTCSSPPDGALATPSTSNVPSPVFPSHKLTRSLLSIKQPTSYQKRFDRAFNEVVAGKQTIAVSPGTITAEPRIPTSMAPGVLFPNSLAMGIPTTPNPAEPAAADGISKTEPALPAPSLFSDHRPWRCPNPGCNKAYRQSNGLKYHQQKGVCDYAIRDAATSGMSAQEAEEQNKPFVCAVGAGCTKRYRQMNGLKYHYLNSGAHGEYGLRLLQAGTHPNPIPSKRPATPNTTPTRPAPYTTAQRTPRPTAATGSWATITSSPASSPMPKALQPIQSGRDAVLFTAVPGDDLLGRSGI